LTGGNSELSEEIGLENSRIVSDLVEFDAVREANDNLDMLASKMPPDALEEFAREVVARLSTNVVSGDVAATLPPAAKIDELCDTLVAPDPDAGALLIAQIQSGGVSTSDIYLLYLAAAARRLGDRWDTDELSFTQVMIGTNRILAIMRGLRNAFRSEGSVRDRRAIFASVPGEEHVVGVSMAADLFAEDGWTVELLVGRTHDEVVDSVGRSEAVVVGLSGHGERSLPALVRLIHAIQVSRPAVRILVSGNIADVAGQDIALAGADAIVTSIPTAMSELRRLRREALSIGA
jgi:methanogenic corrinoid protein MtbC1